MEMNLTPTNIEEKEDPVTLQDLFVSVLHTKDEVYVVINFNNFNGVIEVRVDKQKIFLISGNESREIFSIEKGTLFLLNSNINDHLNKMIVTTTIIKQ